MIAAVADTHTALWHLFNDARLSSAAGDFIEGAAARRRKIAISSISLAEVVYLAAFRLRHMTNWRRRWPTPSTSSQKPSLPPRL